MTLLQVPAAEATSGTPVGGEAVFLLERDAELSELADSTRLGALGYPELVMVHGPAGCGKSALLEAASAQARALGVEVVLIAGPKVGRVQILDAVRPVREAVAKNTELMPADDIGELVQQFLSLSNDRPMLLAVDDAHMLDAESIRLLGEVIRRLGDGHMSVFLADGDLTAVSHYLEQHIIDLARPCDRQLTVRPLTRLGVTELVRSRLKAEPTAQVIEEIYATTGGNIELAHAILDSDALHSRAGQAIPAYGSAFAKRCMLRLSLPSHGRVRKGMELVGTITSRRPRRRLALRSRATCVR
jgi:hypothetical protein